MNCCGPGYKSPKDAIEAPKEKLVYTTIIYCGTDPDQADGLATIDVDEHSPKYSQIINILKLPYPGDEVQRSFTQLIMPFLFIFYHIIRLKAHHFGWNTVKSLCKTRTQIKYQYILSMYN